MIAWKPETRDLVVLRPGRGEGEVAKQRDARRHQRFHGAVPEQTRAMHVLGLIESVAYVATGIRSPSKGPHHWIHQFGDRGEHGHDAVQTQAPSIYAERFMPQLDVDAAGNLVVVRRPSNRFTVRDWIIG